MTKVEYLLICLVEEAAEIQQSATKSLRFGLNDHHPNRTSTNKEELLTELNDLMATRIMLATEGVIPFSNDISRESSIEYRIDKDALTKKIDKVNHYMEISRQRGILEDTK